MIYDLLNVLNNHSPLIYLTQSLWRDEAFSVLLSQNSVGQVVKLTAQDFNPPLYYLILHFWMKIFGTSEIAVRMPSFIFHLLLIYVSYLFAKNVFKFSKLTTYYLLFTIFLNPMLIYFSFEARMYSLLAFLAAASMYFFFTKQWKLYVLFSALGLWTQPFMLFVIISQIFYFALQDSRGYTEGELKQEKRETRIYFLVSLIFIFLLFSPWLPVILLQLTRSGKMWMWPIDWTTLTTVLGNVFTGYEGTPWEIWNVMRLISLFILLSSFLVFWSGKKSKNRDLSNFSNLLMVWLYLPIIFVLIISYFKPIYVNRYIIFCSVAEVFIIVLAINLIKNKLIRLILYTLYFILIIGFNIWFPPLHPKLNFRQALAEVNQLTKPNDLIVSQTPLTFFETSYYASSSKKVFLYNPDHITIPAYVGANLMPPSKMIYNFPKYPNRAFLIHDDASFEVIYQK